MVLNLLLERLSNCYVKPTGCKADDGINLLLERLSNCYVKPTGCKADGGINLHYYICSCVLIHENGYEATSTAKNVLEYEYE